MVSLASVTWSITSLQRCMLPWRHTHKTFFENVDRSTARNQNKRTRHRELKGNTNSRDTERNPQQQYENNCSWKCYLDELVDSVKVIVRSCSLLRNKAFLKGGQSTVHIMLQTRLTNKNEDFVNKTSSCHKTQDVPPCSSNQTRTQQSCWTNRQIFTGWFSGISLTLRCHNVIQSDNHTLTSCLSCAAHRWIFQPCARQATPLWLAMSCKVLFFSSGMMITKQATVINWHIKRRLKGIWLTTRWRKKEAVSL